LIDFCRPDLFTTGSIVRSTGYKVLHRPVEAAALIGNWQIALKSKTAAEIVA
jgi:hypothetical protein